MPPEGSCGQPVATQHISSFVDLAPADGDFLKDVLQGLSQPQKTLPCKYFYDEAGSRLFDAICELPEYYPTRTEMALLEASAAEIAAQVGPHAQLIEYGCGSIQKVRILLDAFDRPAAYVAVDISREHLVQAAEALAADRPDLDVHVVCADFTRPFDLPASGTGRRIGFFPGSTLGNFTRPAAREFLANAASVLGSGGGMLIGVDLRKDRTTLEAAYNDSQGVTAAFNLNLLERINRELDGGFDLDGFAHHAFYDSSRGRVEMHLVSARDQRVQVDGHAFRFAAGETIHTENSYKYGIDEFQEMARSAGFTPGPVWTDPHRLFSIHFLDVV